jgi:hypothetical protein
MKKREDRIQAWHFLPANRRIRWGKWKDPVRTGVVYVHRGAVEICNTGLHASIQAIDALEYAPGPVACLVECWGDVQQHDDKLVCSRRKVLAMADCTRVLHLFACDEAERALALVSSPDARSVEAIRIKRLWVDGGATDAELAAARDAAWAAAEAAAWAAAGAAARDAAWAAAEAAAWAAAGAAAGAAARDAAWAAAEAAAWAAAGAAARDAAWAAAEAAAWAAAGAAAGAAARDAAWAAAEAAAWAAAWAAAEAAARDAASTRLDACLRKAVMAARVT